MYRGSKGKVLPNRWPLCAIIFDNFLAFTHGQIRV